MAFLILNFGALWIGGAFTNSGVNSDWYFSLNKAPWTPPGWVFGAAWTLIMLCFSFYMTYLYQKVNIKNDNNKLKNKISNEISKVYIFQLILNIIWNPVFFYFHFTGTALILISLLFITVLYLFFKYFKLLKSKSILILPYIIWLIIAISLNAYVFFVN